MVSDKKEERRRKQREDITRSLACSIQCGSEIRLGLLNDISKNGLSFRYIDQEFGRIEEGTPCILTLLSADGAVLLSDITATIVYDHTANEEYSYSLLRMRIIGVEFTLLPQRHALRLDLLLKSFFAADEEPKDFAREKSDNSIWANQ